jgi:CRISPR system Cascade subunit CasE
MYLSKLKLNDRDRAVRYDLSDAHALHQRIMLAFPDQQRDTPRTDWNVLFRQEPDSDLILVQSSIDPDWTKFPPGYLTQHDSKPFSPTTSHLELGRTLQFRLKANPSKRDQKTRKLVGIFHQADQLAWLDRQAAQHGFVVKSVDVIPTPSIYGIKAKGTPPIRILTVLYQGVLEITDSAQFTAAIQQGIGRGRSYGCGLLSIARLPT